MNAETVFKRQLLVALNAPGGMVRVWNQPAGKFQSTARTWVQGAPTGAADLCGVVRSGPNRGRLVQIETKVGKGKQSEAQIAWERFVLASGGIYILARPPLALALQLVQDALSSAR